MTERTIDTTPVTRLKKSDAVAANAAGTNPATKGARQPKRQPKLNADDAAEIFQSETHIADRDQMFDTGHREFPPPSQLQMYEGWEGDREARESADDPRSIDTDVVEEFRQLELSMEEPAPMIRTMELQPPVPPAGEQEALTELTDAELRAEADALSIAGRQKMNRFQLLNAVRGVFAGRA